MIFFFLFNSTTNKLKLHIQFDFKSIRKPFNYNILKYLCSKYGDSILTENVKNQILINQFIMLNLLSLKKISFQT